MIKSLFQLLFAHALAGDSSETPNPSPITISSIKFAKGGSLGDLNNAIGWIITTLFFIAGTSAVIYFIYSGITYITSAGNADAAKKGQQGLLYATIGIIIVSVAYFLVTTIADYAAKSI